MSGAQPLLGVEGRPGGPVAGSSQPPCTPPGRETAQAARVAVVPHCVLLDHLHEVPPAAGISVETGDRWARVGARVTRGRMGRANGRGVMDPRRTLRGLRSVPVLHLQWVLQSLPLPECPPTHKLPRNPLKDPRAVQWPTYCFLLTPHLSYLGSSPAGNSPECLPPSPPSPP